MQIVLITSIPHIKNKKIPMTLYIRIRRLYLPGSLGATSMNCDSGSI